MLLLLYKLCHERQKVKADNGTRRAERTDRARNAPERAGRKPSNGQPEYGILLYCCVIAEMVKIAKISLPDDRNKYNIIYIVVCN